MKKLIKDINNNKSTKYDVINNVKKISVYANKVRSLRPNQSWNIIINLSHELRQFFDLSYRDKTHDETDKPPGTTDMPHLESEESAEQRRNKKGQGLKILTPNQMLSRLLITLAQLKVGNDSEKLKNEIIQLICSLYRSKKSSNTIYNNLVNTI